MGRVGWGWVNCKCCSVYNFGLKVSLFLFRTDCSVKLEKVFALTLFLNLQLSFVYLVFVEEALIHNVKKFSISFLTNECTNLIFKLHKLRLHNSCFKFVYMHTPVTIK